MLFLFTNLVIHVLFVDLRLCSFILETQRELGSLYLLLCGDSPRYFTIFLVIGPTSVCQSSPCQNGGTCTPYLDGSGYMCYCERHYQGFHCENDICEFLFIQVILYQFYKTILGINCASNKEIGLILMLFFFLKSVVHGSVSKFSSVLLNVTKIYILHFKPVRISVQTLSV